MGYRAFLYLAAVISTAAAAAAPPLTFADLNASTASDCNLTTAALIIAQELDPKADTAACAQQLDALANELAARIESLATPQEKLDTIARVLYTDHGYASKGPATVFAGLHEVVDHRQWNCLGLSVLYIALGERLDLPMHLVLGPGHALVHYGEGADSLYVETTDRGRVYPGLDYLKSYLPFPSVELERFRTLQGIEAISALVSQTAIGRFPGGKSAAAVPYFRQAIAIDDRNAEAWSGLGAALTASNEIEPAIAAYRKAIELDPKFVEAYGGLGSLLHSQKRLQEAIGVYRDLLVACPRESRGAYNLARLQYEAGDMEAAMGTFQKYVELQAK